MVFIWIFSGLLGLAIVVAVFASRRDAKLRKAGVLPPVGQATMADVERLIREGQGITAIRCYREIHNVGLAEAKKAVEILAAKVKP